MNLLLQTGTLVQQNICEHRGGRTFAKHPKYAQSKIRVIVRY